MMNSYAANRPSNRYVVAGESGAAFSDCVFGGALTCSGSDLNINPNTVEASNGGYREYATVELFLIPREWPPPIATPTFSNIR